MEKAIDKNRQQQLPDIFAYLDYRRYLHDLCAVKKELNPHFSYRYLSQKVQIKSAGFISWVLQGKRNISERLALELARFFRLTATETAYFENLVTFNQASTHEERRFAFDKLIAMRRGSVKQVESDQCAFYRSWYYPALRELVEVMPLTDANLSDAASVLHPAVKVSEVREAMAILERLGFVKKNDEGRYVRCDQVISSREHVPMSALHDYQIDCMDLAKGAFDRFEKSERELSTVTMSIDSKAYLTILERLAAVRREILEIARTVKDPDRVMQLNLHYFPLSLQRKA